MQEFPACGVWRFSQVRVERHAVDSATAYDRYVAAIGADTSQS